MPKGNMAQADRGSVQYDDMRADAVLERLERAEQALIQVNQEGLVDATDAQHVATAYNALSHIIDYLPHIEAWCVGYPLFETGWTTWTAHVTEAEARRWLKPLRDAERSRGRQRAHTGPDQWQVRLRDTFVTNMIVPGTDPTEFLAEGNGKWWWR